MPFKMEPFFLKAVTTFVKKAQTCMLERVLNTSLQLYLFHALQLKNREDKPYQYQSVQRIFSKYTLRETYS